MSLKRLDENDTVQTEKAVRPTQVSPDDIQVMQKTLVSGDAQVIQETSVSEDTQKIQDILPLETTHMLQEISAPEDIQPTRTISTSNNKEMKDLEYHQDYWEDDSAKTDLMIQNEVSPIGPISSVQSLSKTGSTAEGHCRRHPIDMTKRQILKNVIVVSVVFLLNFLAYGGLMALQSSLHVQQGMGVIAMAVVYGSFALASLTLPKIAISLLGHKWSMSVALTGYLLWMAVNGFGVWATVLPASIVVGICGATLWTTQGSYLTILARHYAIKTDQQTAPVTSLFFGIFTAIFVNYSVFGSIISSTILSRSSSSSSFLSDHHNQTIDVDDELLVEWCGLNDCPRSSSNSTLFVKPPAPVIWTLVGVYVAIGSVALLICCVFVDPIPRSWVRNTKSTSSNTRHLAISSLLATVKQMRHVKQLLLIPITIYLGMKQTFLDAEYTRSYVSCFLAIWMVGWCLIPASICRSLGSFLSGKVTKYTGIVPVLIFGLLLDLSFQLTLWLWTPSSRQMSLFFIVPVFNALADSVWTVQLRAVYGVVFSDDTEAAFSCYEFLMSCGQFLAFSYSSFLCTRTKLLILTSMLALGVSLLFVVILVFRRNLAKPLRHRSPTK